MSTITTSEKKKLSYFREVQSELKKVSWTSRQELIFCTKTVVIATFLFGFAVYLVDLALRAGIDLAGALFRMICG